MAQKPNKNGDWRANLRQEETDSEPTTPNTPETGPVGAAKGRKLRKVTKPARAMQLVQPIGKLSRQGELYFNAVAEFLETTETLQVVDSMLLTMLAQEVEKWAWAYEQIQAQGPQAYLETNPNGLTHQSGLAQMLEKSRQAIVQLSAKLGLSPKDRATIWSTIENARNAAKGNADNEEL